MHSGTDTGNGRKCLREPPIQPEQVGEAGQGHQERPGGNPKTETVFPPGVASRASARIYSSLLLLVFCFQSFPPFLKNLREGRKKKGRASLSYVGRRL